MVGNPYPFRCFFSAFGWSRTIYPSDYSADGRGSRLVKFGEIDEKGEDEIKGAAAATENYGNFYGQNCFMGASGTLLIVSTLVAQGYEVDALQIAMASWPIAIVSMVVGIVMNFFVDRRLVARYAKKSPAAK